MIKNVINELFSSSDMKSYLCEHVSELSKHQIIDMIAEASSVPLSRKSELFEMLAETENLDAAIAAELDNKERIIDYSYKSYACRIRKALNGLMNSADGDIFLLNTYYRAKNDFKHSEAVPFTSYEKAVQYIALRGYNNENVYHTLDKWHTDSEGNMEEIYWYVIANGQAIYFCDNETGLDVYPECRLNLPVPFEPGDIITVQDIPFAEKRYGIIIDVGDNIDCCCVQVLYVTDK